MHPVTSTAIPNAHRALYQHHNPRTHRAIFGKNQIDKNQIDKDYQSLKDEFVKVVEEALKNPVSGNNVVPPWKSRLQEISRSPLANKSLGDYIIEAHPDASRLLRDEYAKSTLFLESIPSKHQAQGNYQKLNLSFADLEANISRMDQSSHAVFVGSGPQPNTVLSYARYAGHVTGLDIDPVAINATKNLTRNYPKNKVDFALANGNAFDYSQTSHVGIAVMVPNKDEVLRRIQKTAPSGCFVIIRSVDGIKRAMYDDLSPDVIEGFEKVATVYGNGNITHAIILKKI